MAWLLTTHSFLTVFLIPWPYLGTQQSLWRKSKLTLKQSTVLESFIPVCHPETEMDLWSTPGGMRREPEPGGEHSFHFLHVSSVLTCDTKGMTVIQPQERRLHTWEFNTKAFFTHSLSSIYVQLSMTTQPVKTPLHPHFLPGDFTALLNKTLQAFEHQPCA